MFVDYIEKPDSLRLDDGRNLAFRCFGKADAYPVHFLHGFPGSSLQGALLHEAARKAGVHLIASDRPGFGESSAQRARSIAGFSRDIVALADHLGHARFSLLGISCGGPYALACAQTLPARVERVALLAGIGPMDQPPLRRGQLAFLRLLFGLARIHPGLCSPLLALDRLMFLRNPVRAAQAVAGMLTRPDQQLLASDPLALQIFAHSLAEAYGPGLAGARSEAGLIARPHGIDYGRIRQAVCVFQSDQDRHVPPAMGHYQAAALPHARCFDFPEEGHLSIVVRQGEAALRFLAVGES